APVCRSRFAQPGSPVALKVSTSSSASVATGWNCHVRPAVAVSTGAPLIAGVAFGSAWPGAAVAGGTSCDSGPQPASAMPATNAVDARRQFLKAMLLTPEGERIAGRQTILAGTGAG